MFLPSSAMTSAEQRASWRGALPWLFPALATAGLAIWVSSQRALPLLGEPDGPTREDIVIEMRRAEPGFRREALETFPGDPWSQDDHFAVKEMGLVEKLARERKLRVGAVLVTIDRDIKRGGIGARERGRVAPCMPRPFYE
jgi:hypothetical protein